MPPWIVVVDLEATCCDRGSIPDDERETIEFGALPIRGHMMTQISFQTLVKPQRHPILTPFCTTLTGISQAMVDPEVGFKQAFRMFLRNFDDLRPWYFCSWGSFDTEQIERDRMFHGVAEEMPKHINLAAIFKSLTGRKCHHRRAMQVLGVNPLGKHHRAWDDAANVAAILQHLFQTERVEWDEETEDLRPIVSKTG